jgi:hypothetical protein
MNISKLSNIYIKYACKDTFIILKPGSYNDTRGTYYISESVFTDIKTTFSSKYKLRKSINKIRKFRNIISNNDEIMLIHQIHNEIYDNMYVGVYYQQNTNSYKIPSLMNYHEEIEQIKYTYNDNNISINFITENKNNHIEIIINTFDSDYDAITQLLNNLSTTDFFNITFLTNTNKIAIKKP